MDIVALFCDLDDFCRWFEPRWQTRLLSAPGKHRQRPCGLALSEVLTLLVAFHDSDYRSFKHFYWNQVGTHGRGEFPQLPSYTRFIERIPSALVPLGVYLMPARQLPGDHGPYEGGHWWRMKLSFGT